MGYYRDTLATLLSSSPKHRTDLLMSDTDDLRFEYEVLSQKISTRESSTLTIATWLIAGALIFFVIVFEGLGDWRIYAFGLVLIVCAVAYREVTVFTIDRVELARLRELQHNKTLFPNGLPQAHPFWSFLRSLVFRGVMWSFAVFVLRYLALPIPFLGDLVTFVVVMLVFPAGVSIVEWKYVRECGAGCRKQQIGASGA